MQRSPISSFCLNGAKQWFDFGPQLRIVDLVDGTQILAQPNARWNCRTYALARARDSTSDMVDIIQEREEIGEYESLWETFPI